MAKSAVKQRKVATFQVDFESTGESREVVALERHPDSKKTAIVTFSDDSQALISSKHFNRAGEPEFLDEDNNLMEEFTVRMIEGTPWVVTASGGPKLPGSKLPA